MLLAVEGGRFFSSSASGYSNGLNLLLLGHKKEEKPMRVTPWNQYHLVAQEPDPDPDPDPDLQLANKRCVCGCASFSCFGRPAAGLESPAIEPTHQQNVLKTSSDLEKVEETLPTSDFVDGDGDGNSTNVTFCLKSSLKIRVAIGGVNNNNDDVNEVENGAGQIDRRNVQWTDVIGGELVEIREFEPSEHSDSDDEFEHSSGKTCSCRIM